MQVLKRGNRGREEVNFNKITQRIAHLSRDLKVQPVMVAQNVISKLYDGISTKELDDIAADFAYSMMKVHPDYTSLAARIKLSNLHKESFPSFTQNMQYLAKNTKFISPRVTKLIDAWGPKFDSMIIHSRDNFYDYRALNTLIDKYFMKYPVKGPNGKIKEYVCDRPQYLHMRVAIQQWGPTLEEIEQNPGLLTDEKLIQPYLDEIKKCYKSHSSCTYTHATPTLYNSCLVLCQLISCFLLGTDDSVEGIMKNATACAEISKLAGGLGGHYHCIRSIGSIISTSGGKSMGLCNQAKILNEIVFCFNQGGKRNGSLALYLEPWHGEIAKFVTLKRQDGVDEERARRLFYAGWIPDLFVKAVINNEPWYLFSEHECPGLSSTYGEEFEKLYKKYLSEGKSIGTVPAAELYIEMMKSQIETGAFYICFKDHVNRKSNQMNIGTIKSSNLCTEIMEVSGPDRYAVCCLASIRLHSYVSPGLEDDYDYGALYECVRQITRNLNKVLDTNAWPRPEARLSAEETRAIGIGVQGLADVFMMMRIPYLSERARKIDLKIFETIYHAALSTSADLAEKDGPYKYFPGSPASQGILQFDLWARDKEVLGESFGAKPEPGFYDWEGLKERIKKVGLRNSLVTALMPTATTSIILGSTEMHEPIETNLGTRDTLSGKIIVINDYLVKHLMELGLWNEKMYNKIVLGGGSIQSIQEIPKEVREIYLTVWEMSQKEILLRAAQRGSFIDQSQSLNLYFEGDSKSIPPKLKSAFIYAWKIGLKTGLYYLKTRPAVDPRKVGTSSLIEEVKPIEKEIKPDSKSVEVTQPLNPENLLGPEPEPKSCPWNPSMKGKKKPEDCFVCGS